MNNNISENIGERCGGGGIHLLGASFYTFSPTITNNAITGNKGGIYGGGINCWSSSFPTIINNTITGNTATYGGGIYCRDGSWPIIVNTILWGNDVWKSYPSQITPAGKEICLGFSGSVPSALTIDYSDVEGGQSLVYVESGCTLNWGSGMIDADPLFVKAGSRGDYYLPHVEAGQPLNSPCVNAGEWVISRLPERISIGTTRTDFVKDDWIIDLGYHYPERKVFSPDPLLEEAPEMNFK